MISLKLKRRTNNMQPIIKWPGGKSSEIDYIKDIIPANYERYVEPFCGGAAVYFYLEPNKSIINDISQNLTSFYQLIQNEDPNFKSYMYELNLIWNSLKLKSKSSIEQLKTLFIQYKSGTIAKEKTKNLLQNHIQKLLQNEKYLILEKSLLTKEMQRTLVDKFFRTYKNEIKLGKSLSNEDLEENLLTGISGGIYMAARSEFNKLEHKIDLTDIEYSKKIALFYFVREFCYGSMFRYNKNGDFNIPYGGKGYNHKDYKKKLDIIFNKKTISLLKNTEIRTGDFEKVFDELTSNDFVFLDLPYDTDFSNYENKSFDKQDQDRLAKVLERTKAKFILIIKNTPFIFNLYNKECFKIRSFKNAYSYCVKNRNNRSVEHLIITNY